MKNLFTLLFFVALAGCSRKMLPTLQTVIKDSIIKTEKTIHVRDTIYRRGDSVKIAIAIPCPDAVVNQVVTSGKTKLSVQLKNGLLSVDCQADSLQSIIDSLITLKSYEVYKTITNTVTVTVPVTVVKYRVPKWCWYLLTINVLALGWFFKTPLLSLTKKAIGI